MHRRHAPIYRLSRAAEARHRSATLPVPYNAARRSPRNTRRERGRMAARAVARLAGSPTSAAGAGAGAAGAPVPFAAARARCFSAPPGFLTR
eukprot:4196963-Prymnesium_polylepis.1